MAVTDMMQCWVSLIHAATYLRKGLEHRFREDLGISLAEQDLIKQIAVNGGAISLSDLGQRIYFSKAGVTRMLDRLEASGWVERRPIESDRRSLSAVLTPEGEKLFQDSRKVLREYVEFALASKLDGDSLAALDTALEELLRNHGVWYGQQAHLRGESE